MLYPNKGGKDTVTVVCALHTHKPAYTKVTTLLLNYGISFLTRCVSTTARR